MFWRVLLRSSNSALLANAGGAFLVSGAAAHQNLIPPTKDPTNDHQTPTNILADAR
jgi:hypothetical protein